MNEIKICVNERTIVLPQSLKEFWDKNPNITEEVILMLERICHLEKLQISSVLVWERIYDGLKICQMYEEKSKGSLIKPTPVKVNLEDGRIMILPGILREEWERNKNNKVIRDRLCLMARIYAIEGFDFETSLAWKEIDSTLNFAMFMEQKLANN